MYKKIIVCLLSALLSCAFMFAQDGKGVKFENGTFEEILLRAQKNKKGAKLIFLDCYTSWCGPCKQMAKEVFTQKQVGDYFNANFVNIKIDMEKGEGPALAKKYSVTGYPTFLILTLEGDEIGRIVGGDAPDKFIAAVEKAKDLNSSPMYLKKRFDNNKTVENASKYLNTLYDAYMYEKGMAFLEENITVFEPRELFDRHLWLYVFTSMGNSKKIRDYVAAHKEAANEVIGKQMADRALAYGYIDAVTAYLSGRVELSKEEVVYMAERAQLLMDPNDKFSAVCSKVAIFYASGNMAEIEKMYTFDNMKVCTLSDMNSLEQLFATLKGISKESIAAYYDAKEIYFKKVYENCKLWKAEYMKN